VRRYGELLKQLDVRTDHRKGNGGGTSSQRDAAPLIQAKHLVALITDGRGLGEVGSPRGQAAAERDARG
jgi:hypothetical protein